MGTGGDVDWIRHTLLALAVLLGLVRVAANDVRQWRAAAGTAMAYAALLTRGPLPIPEPTPSPHPKPDGAEPASTPAPHQESPTEQPTKTAETREPEPAAASEPPTRCEPQSTAVRRGLFGWRVIRRGG